MPCSDQHFIPILDELDQQAREAEARAAAARPRRRGGPRPGSGPPKGNLNALKHGRYSRRHKKLLEALLEVPEARQTLIDMANRDRQRVRKAELEAAYLLMRWLATNNPNGLTAAIDGAALGPDSHSPAQKGAGVPLSPSPALSSSVRAEPVEAGVRAPQNDQARNNQPNKAVADMEKALVAKISKNATKKRTPKPKGQPNAGR